MWLGARGEVILFLQVKGHYDLVCFGPARHYRKDGSCAHTADLMVRLKSDWHRKRTRVTPFGNRRTA